MSRTSVNTAETVKSAEEGVNSFMVKLTSCCFLGGLIFSGEKEYQIDIELIFFYMISSDRIRFMTFRKSTTQTIITLMIV